MLAHEARTTYANAISVLAFRAYLRHGILTAARFLSVVYEGICGNVAVAELSTFHPNPSFFFVS